ncbi:MAG: hypothetical protein ABIF18_03360 [archaeon]
MGLFNLFKKLARENRVEEIVIEKLAFSDIENWIKDKTKQNEFKQNEIILVIKDKIKKHANEINNKIKILDNFDIETKKEKEHIKRIVNNNKKDYIRAVENFLEKLNDLKINEFEEFMKRVNEIFLDFNKSSYKNYERATILIGKEMANTKEDIRTFSNDLFKTYEENKDIVNFFKIISQIISKYQNINLINNTLSKITEEKSSLNKKIGEKEKEDKILKERIKEIKKSQNYLNFLNSRKRLEFLKSESKKDILELKQLIDFKVLANFFHINPKQMKIVKNHKEDFYAHFIKDNGKSIIELINEMKLNNDKISGKIKYIYSKLEEIKNSEQEIKDDETQEFYFRMGELESEIDNLKIERAKEEKRYGRLETSKEQLIDTLKQEFSKMNVDVV